jgi:hypothetical protein
VSALESLFKQAKRAKAHGCPICGAKNKAVVVVQVRETNEVGQIAKGSRTLSRQVSLCEEHAGLAYLAALAALEENAR